MKTYRIKVDGKVYEMDIALAGEAVFSEPESGVKVGEKLAFELRTETEPERETGKAQK